MKRSITIFLISAPAVLGFAPSPPQLPSPSALFMAKGRRGGIGAGGNSKLNKPKSIGGSDMGGEDDIATTKQSNWAATSIPSIKSLPSEKDEVKLIDTQVPSLIDKGTNPKGAVSIVNYKDKTYCFSFSCASCKIPLTKAKVLDPSEETGDDARLQCDFCGATYNIRSGAPVKKEGGKLLGFLFSKSEGENLPVYGLGEQGGKVFIDVPSKFS